ncbi:D-alanine--D-alanine ligase [Sunxiuqinia elliptica]|uniref:D-alanine--D-alanine ligase n=1 Tax=Sunxiuqinia elliptica TaxID=655355 RepID=A0A4R6H3J4_9BACT|nr:D-alanine--D-alanine ligase [Sunxiuqinia elliptica]TDO02630.1 D-alanine-D-alanine ligase [Sunxiuqinia elliptica]TDO58632.1 D-alanine-D-alanine ligase [Sunxiuqinia elliptica]
MKKNIAVVYGGDSSEYVVSVKSSKNVLNSINQELFKPWAVEMKGTDWKLVVDGEPVADIDKQDFSVRYKGQNIRFDFAYITIHGTPGEDGILQGYFDLLKIPYSTCGVQSSALTFNKYYCSNYLKNFGFSMAKSARLTKGDVLDVDALVEELGLPVFVKPNAGGSSFGITKVKRKEELLKAVEKAWEESSEALVEEFVEGLEITSGLVKMGDKALVFPVTEVLPKNEFFDFEAKYTKGATEEITPARISDELTQKCQQLSSRIYDLCDCKGIVRVDYILRDGEFYFLEVNTTPGMTATSFIPQQIEAMGETLEEVLTQIIQYELK